MGFHFFNQTGPVKKCRELNFDDERQKIDEEYKKANSYRKEAEKLLHEAKNKLNSDISKVKVVEKTKIVEKLVPKNKQKLSDFNFVTSSNPSPKDQPNYPSEDAKFPDSPKETVKQKILQEEVKIWSLKFITYIRNTQDIIDAKNLVKSILTVDPKANIIIGSTIESKDLIIEGAQIKQMSPTETLGKVLNTLIKTSDSEICLLLKPNTLLTKEHSDLKKIHAAFTHTDTTIVSGANRDIDTGELYLPCYRIFLNRWTYQIDYGYIGSLYYKNEPPVAICGRTEFPLAIKVSQLTNDDYFDELLQRDELVLEEYYIKTALRIKAVVTPHCMFQVKRKQEQSINHDVFVENWMPLAKKYRFDNILGLDKKRKFLCREDWTLPIHHFYFMMNRLYTPTCNYRLYHIFYRYFVDFWKKHNIDVYLEGSGDNLGAYKFGSFLPWDGDWDVIVDLNIHEFRNKYKPILQKKFQIDEHGHVNFKPTHWGKQFKGLGNDVLISAHFVGPQKQYSYVKIDGVLYKQVYNPFERFLINYKNSYLDDRVHHDYEKKKERNEFVCPPGHTVADSWYDFGGTGTNQPSAKKIRNHPACVEKKTGSFFDYLPCPCDRLTYGLSAKKFEV